MIEMIDDKFFSFLRKFVEKNKVKVAVTSDHSTPCGLKQHSDDPVPVLLFNSEVKKETGSKFDESHALKGSLGRISGKSFLKKIGFV